MSLASLGIRNLRNLAKIDLVPHPHFNLIFGPNAAGKTSLLEAIYFLGRARTFRSAGREALIRRGEEAATVFGVVLGPSDASTRIGVERGGEGVRMRVNGSPARSAAMLARVLPVLLITPESHRLVSDGPRHRRRFLDWGLFHVEPSFFPAWQRYQRALKQRNAALRMRDGLQDAWNEELLETGKLISSLRDDYIKRLSAGLAERIGGLVDVGPVELELSTGWPRSLRYEEALTQSRARDVAAGFTHFGPHRAELLVRVAERPAHERLSRGQQKLLISGLIMAQAQLYREVAGNPCVLLVDDLAAELDRQHRTRLLASLADTGSQLFVTCTDPADLGSTDAFGKQMFHVEHGAVAPVV